MCSDRFVPDICARGEDLAEVHVHVIVPPFISTSASVFRTLVPS